MSIKTKKKFCLVDESGKVYEWFRLATTAYQTKRHYEKRYIRKLKVEKIKNE